MGIAQGIEKGIEQGKHLGKLETARKMLARGMDVPRRGGGSGFDSELQ